MNRKEIKNKIEQNQDYIIAISYNNYYYNVNYILAYNLDFNDDTVVVCYDIQNGCIVDYEFTMEDLLKAKDLKFYVAKEI